MAAKPPPAPTVSDVVALMQKARSRGRGRRSPVMIWMLQNREELEAAFTQTAPAWSVMAAYLGSNGIMDGDGKPPTAQAARAAWGRVKAEAKAKTPAAPVAQMAEPAKVTVPLPQDDPEPSRPTQERFKMATLRNHTPAAPPPDPPPPPPAVPQQDSKAVIAAFVARGARPRGFRKPEPKDE